MLLLKMTFVKVVVRDFNINIDEAYLSCPAVQCLVQSNIQLMHIRKIMQVHFTISYKIEIRGRKGRVTQRPACRVSTAHTLLQHSQQSGSEHTTSYVAAAAGES